MGSGSSDHVKRLHACVDCLFTATMTSTDRERSEDDTGIVAENISTSLSSVSSRSSPEADNATELELGLLKGPKYGHFKYYACWDPRLMGVFKDW